MPQAGPQYQPKSTSQGIGHQLAGYISVLPKGIPKMSEDTVIVSQSHLYLFWSTGVYYVAALCQTYQVVLVVPEYYRQDGTFRQACERLSVKAVVYYPYCDRSLRLHRRVYKIFNDALELYQPVAVLQHDYIGVENMYLFHLSRKLNPDCGRLTILSSMPSTDNTHAFLDELLSIRIKRYQQQLPLPTGIWRMGIKGAKWMISSIGNCFLPSLVTNTSPYLPPSTQQNIDIVPRKTLFDHYLVFDENERDYLAHQFRNHSFTNNHPFMLIRSPLMDSGKVNRRLYPAKAEITPQVAIFPSLIAIRTFEQEQSTLDKWVEALSLIHQQLPDYRMMIKFHPGRRSGLVQQVQKYLLNRCPFVELVGVSVSAESLMQTSKVVVGDVSTTLWWANQQPSKVVISLGMASYSVSENMRLYPGIHYIEPMAALSELELKALLRREQSKVSDRSRPSLVEVIASKPWLG